LAREKVENYIYSPLASVSVPIGGCLGGLRGSSPDVGY
jgi:hypothetical protein